MRLRTLTTTVALVAVTGSGCSNKAMLRYANDGIARAEASGGNCRDAGYRDGQAWMRRGGVVPMPGGMYGARDVPATALSGAGSAAFGPAVPLVLLLAYGAQAKKNEWEMGYSPDASACARSYGDAFGRGVNRGTYVRIGRDVLLGALIGVPIFYLTAKDKQE